jgi:heat shock protein HslJ
MKALQFPLIALALGITLSANKCSNTGDVPTDAMAALKQGGKWGLATLKGKEPQLPEGMEETPYIAVDSISGRLSGFAGCNRMAGTVEIHGDSISFPGLVSTRMYCEGRQQLEDSFMAALRDASTFTLKGDRLTLLNAGKELAVLQHGK